MTDTMKDADKTNPVTARIPVRLIRKLDTAARAARRSRSAELLLRLEQSFRREASGEVQS